MLTEKKIGKKNYKRYCKTNRSFVSLESKKKKKFYFVFITQHVNVLFVCFIPIDLSQKIYWHTRPGPFVLPNHVRRIDFIPRPRVALESEQTYDEPTTTVAVIQLGDDNLFLWRVGQRLIPSADRFFHFARQVVAYRIFCYVMFYFVFSRVVCYSTEKNGQRTSRVRRYTILFLISLEKENKILLFLVLWPVGRNSRVRYHSRTTRVCYSSERVVSVRGDKSHRLTCKLLWASAVCCFTAFTYTARGNNTFTEKLRNRA